MAGGGMSATSHSLSDGDDGDAHACDERCYTIIWVPVAQMVLAAYQGPIGGMGYGAVMADIVRIGHMHASCV